MVLIVAVSTYIPTNSVRGSLFSTLSQHLLSVDFLRMPIPSDVRCCLTLVID